LVNISDISISQLDSEILVNGWIRNTRNQSNLAFIEIYDGSTSKSIQAISEDAKLNELIKPLSIGSSISIKAIVVKHPKEGIELKLMEIVYIGKINDPITYILNAKKMGLDTLRDHQDVRCKTRTFNAVFRIRAGLSQATHNFFHSKGFHHLNPNIITTSDCEGAGEVFTITNMLGKNCSDIPKVGKTELIDYNKDFFEKQAFLTVSSQLQLELLCAGLGKVWTSNKSFRSEKSKTNRHLAEFEHIEW
jgi:asparaginyl-tRNA synthetase